MSTTTIKDYLLGYYDEFEIPEKPREVGYYEQILEDWNSQCDLFFSAIHAMKRISEAP